MNGPGDGFSIDKKAPGNVVGCDNAATDAAAGLANVDCAP